MFSSWLVLFTSSPLQAQRSELNAKVRMLREELQHLQEQCSYVGEVVKPMDKKKFSDKTVNKIQNSRYDIVERICRVF